jgi:peptidoglycan hydrolase CwlO-like protein
MDEELKQAIEEGATLQSVDESEKEEYEEAKRKRLEELKALAEQIEAQIPEEERQADEEPPADE